MTTPDYEMMLQSFYTSFLQSGDNCIDVGAHLGRHALPMAGCIAPLGCVFAFEPIPFIADEFRVKLAASTNLAAVVQFQQCALSDDDGEADFTVVRDNPGYSGLLPRHYDGPVTTEIIRVQLRKLDDLARQMPKIRYIKIDCEGGELRVLRGARSLLHRDRPVVSFECGDASLESYDYNAGDIFDFWASLQYTLQSITEKQLDREGFVSACARQEYWDYIATP